MIKKKTTTITFRIDGEIDNKLRKIAEDQNLSLNTLANQILGNYVQIERYMEKFGILMMSQDAFLAILDILDEKQIIQLASDVGSREPKEFILFKWKDMNSEIVTDFIIMYFEHCGYGTCDLEKTESEVAISIHHKFGKKGTTFLKTFLESLIQSTLDTPCKTIITEDSVTIRFSK
ncbi:MAG: hypothetical protein IIB02_07645 [Thaumarchaeota archaeon]|nr:hypothetical protein [Nitrososphaerota archaeon]